jgi:hypothetical protein
MCWGCGTKAAESSPHTLRFNDTIIVNTPPLLILNERVTSLDGEAPVESEVRSISTQAKTLRVIKRPHRMLQVTGGLLDEVVPADGMRQILIGRAYKHL